MAEVFLHDGDLAGLTQERNSLALDPHAWFAPAMPNVIADRLTVDDLMLTDGGLETVLIFHDGLDLPDFAAFPVLDAPGGRERLGAYLQAFLDVAERHETGFVLETPTWRASADWGARLGYSHSDLRRICQDSVDMARALRDGWTGAGKVLISGNVGPRGDGYVPGVMMTAAQAADYHRAQITALSDAGADLVTSATLSYADEAAGVVTAAAQIGTPVVAGFTVEVDGRLPSGETLKEAIERVDQATDGYAAWFMLNCAHPEHMRPALDGGDWAGRIGALRVNASRLSHAELDEATELDDGDPRELAQECSQLAALLPGLRVLGGCCGTDVRHVAAMAQACRPQS